MNIIGIDIGGNFTKFALIQNGQIVHRGKTPTKTGCPATLLKNLCTIIDGVLSATNVPTLDGIGIGVAGMVDTKTGKILSATNLGITNTDITAPLSQKYGSEVKIGNDLALFALAASKLSGIENLVYIALGTGINAGVVIDGKVLAGIEYGHTTFIPNHPTPCGCGRYGCVEQFINGKILVENGPTDTLINHISIMLTNIANTYRPSTIYVGGATSTHLKSFEKQLNENIKLSHFGYKNAPPITIKICDLGNDGGVLGAAFLFTQ